MKRLYSLLLAIITSLTAMAFEVDGIYYSVLSSSEMTVQVTSGNTKYTGEVVIPEKVTYLDFDYKVISIGQSAFSDCYYLASIIIPNSVTSIGVSAFYRCQALTDIIIPNSVMEIGENAFSRCSLLTSVAIPNSVAKIGESAFSECSSLTSVIIPNSVAEIGESAFSGCSSLTSVIIPNSVTEIGKSAFSGCSSLTSVTIPNSVVEIGNNAFSGCWSITDIDIEDGGSILKLGDRSVYNSFFSDSQLKTVYIGRPLEYPYSSCAPFRGQEKLISLTIGNNVTTISSWAFFGCQALTDIIIPHSVMEIGESAFSGCSSLTSVAIPNSVATIGESAFSGCSSLTSVTIPNSVTEIGNNAFNGCIAITDIKMEDGESKLKLGSNGSSEGLFNDCSLETLHLGRTVEYSYAPFKYQTNLTTLTIGETVVKIGWSIFNGCSALESVVIPNSVTSIGRWAFSGCSALIAINIPDSMTQIDEYAFGDCTALINIISTAVIPPSIETNSFSSESYKYALVTVSGQSLNSYKEKWSQFHHLMGSGTEKSAEYHVDPAGALMNMISPDEAESITSLKLTGTLNGTDLLTINKLTNLKKLDISGCTIVSGGMPYYETDNERFGAKDNTLGQYWSRALDLLSEIDLPTTLTTLDKEALLNKKYLTTLTIPSSVTAISYRALYGCDNIKQLILQDSDTRLYLGEGFSNKNLEYLYLGRPIYTDSYTYTYKAPFGNSLKLKKVIVGRTVTKIESSQFSSCSNLTDLLLPNTLQSIGSYAFSGCSSLEQVAIPNPTESIGAGAFDGCSGLKEITLPGSTRSIGQSAFSGCSQLANVYVINPIPPVIESNTFDAATQTAATLHVPEDSKAINWVHPYWGQFKKIENWTVGTTTEFVAENVSYHITSEADATVEISAVALGGSRAASEVKIPATVRFNDKVYTVAGVANNGFAGAQMTEVELPATVNYVGLAAFKGCQALTKVTVLNTLPPSADVSSFDEATYANAKLSVVEEAADAYKEHSVWGLFGLDSTPADPSEIDEISEDMSAVRPVVVPGGIDFEGVDGNTAVEIYSISGQRLYAGPARRKDLAAGYYIVRIGRHAFKIMVK